MLKNNLNRLQLTTADLTGLGSTVIPIASSLGLLGIALAIELDTKWEQLENPSDFQ